MKALVVRTRPAIGDALMLSPLIKAIAEAYRKQIDVVTSPSYMKGGMVQAFKGNPYVDRVLFMKPERMKGIDCFECNDAFVEYEDAYGGVVPMGIPEFWLRKFDYYKPGMDLRPIFRVNDDARAAVAQWLKPEGKKVVGVVLRAGDKAREWDYGDRSRVIVEGLWGAGYHTVTIDLERAGNAMVGQHCVGQNLQFVTGVLEKCDVVLTPDTGILHLAEAVGTKTVSLWGKIDPNIRTATYRHCFIMPADPGPRCDPGEHCPACQGRQHYACVRKISISQILEGVRYAAEHI